MVFPVLFTLTTVDLSCLELLFHWELQDGDILIWPF